MSELDKLYEFVMESSTIDDFHIRFNFFLSMCVASFETELSKKNHLPFNSHIFIDKLNKNINSIIKKINFIFTLKWVAKYSKKINIKRKS